MKKKENISNIYFANEMPSISFDGYLGRIFSGSEQRFGELVIPDYKQSHFMLPLTMSYELDLWGANRQKTKSYKKQLEMMLQDERAFYISLTSSFAIDYYNLIKIDKLIEIQKQLISIQTEIFENTKLSFQNGVATTQDIIAEEKALTYLKEELNNLEEKQEMLINQINIYLADRNFGKVARSDFENVYLPDCIPEKIDSSCLSKRPDIIKAQKKLEKITYDIKVARRDFLPKFVILGTAGFNAYQFRNIFGAHTGLADIGVAPHLDIFDGGRKLNILRYQKHSYNIAQKEYEKAVLTSIQETNDSLFSLKNTNKNYNIVNARKNLCIKDCELTQKKELFGIANKIDVLFDEEKLLLLEKEEVSSKINCIIATINLYKALGGVDISVCTNNQCL